MKKIFLLFILFLSVSFVNAKELPKLYLNGDISNMNSKKDERTISIIYEDNDQKYEGFSKIKIQGNTSINFEKKNYTIKLYEDKNLDNKLKIDFGWGKQNKYVLKANWIDKTHARNIVSARIASQIQAKYNLLNDTPNHGLIDGYPIEVYNNDEFLGLYTLNIPKDAWMFNMDEKNPDNIVLSGEFHNDIVFFKKEAVWDESWEVEVGEENEETLNRFNRLSDFIRNSSDKGFKKDINNYLNLDSVINYFIISEYFELQDNVGKNMLLVTYDGKIWYTLLYDMDASFGTDFGGNLYNYSEYEWINYNTLFKRLAKNFGPEIADRYFELKNEFLNEEYIMKEFNDFENQIPDETFIKEQNRWDNIPGYDLNQINVFLKKRTLVIDKYMKSLYPNNTNLYIIGSITIVLLATVFIIYRFHSNKLHLKKH